MYYIWTHTYGPKKTGAWIKHEWLWVERRRAKGDAVRLCEYGPPRISQVYHQGDTFYECDAGHGSRSYSRTSGTSPANRIGPQDGGARWLVPATDEIRRAARVAEWRRRIYRFGEWTKLADEQIEGIAVVLGWADEKGLVT